HANAPRFAPHLDASLPYHPTNPRASRSVSVTRSRRLSGLDSGGCNVSAVRELQLIAKSEFDRADRADLALLADMCRANALVAVKRAGSGHIGSSFSALDIVVQLLWRELNVAEVGWDDPERDIFFSSKGHDVPGLYAALHALGVIPAERLLKLRRL